MAHIQLGNGEIINLTEAETRNSREAKGGYVYMLDNIAYKPMNLNNSIKGVFKNCDRSYGLPSVYLDVFNAKFSFQGSNGIDRNEDATIIKMKRIDTSNNSGNHFFQISHGGRANLENFINNEGDEERLKRILRALCAARESNLKDPQGFYSSRGSNPILFCDIHCGTTPSLEIEELIEYTQNRMKNSLDD
ncbi:hypothetical protein EAE91_07395 [Photorhabdus noenieputensis]|uniref:hypothetical protein n=1 Tax=Photorhabdus noenieputensis TaxID=1208607 RepID=UPI001BD6AE09|nr:hypothetical protein [Photorhabdus noenieputensis]MBS9437004.1 hypothetical protein [Photorhabdus noenieputensis]MCK3670434.1 hypothetical protein [Photorhabdus noenieputensis]